jgi:hypothetical protein
MVLTTSGFLKEQIGKVLPEMVSEKDQAKAIEGFPHFKVSLILPNSGIVAIMHGKDFPEFKGIKEDQKIYIYQEA